MSIPLRDRYLVVVKGLAYLNEAITSECVGNVGTPQMIRLLLHCEQTKSDRLDNFA